MLVPPAAASSVIFPVALMTRSPAALSESDPRPSVSSKVRACPERLFSTVVRFLPSALVTGGGFVAFHSAPST